MAQQVNASGDMPSPRPAKDGWADVVLEVQRAVVLVHGFVHAAKAISLGVAMVWMVFGPESPVSGRTLSWSLLGCVFFAALGMYELYLSAQPGRRLAGLPGAMIGCYALLAFVAVIAAWVPIPWYRPGQAIWLSYLTIGTLLPGPTQAAAGVQALLAISAAALAVAVGRRSLVASAPAWLLAWPLAHGLRAVVGASYHLVYDLGAAPLRRWLEARPRYQALFLTGASPAKVIAGALGGPALAALGAVVGWGLIWLGQWLIPPILHPLLYLIVVDLVLLPLLPLASILVIWLYRLVAWRGEAWVFVASPVFVALAPVAALVLFWLTLHRWVARAFVSVGQWQVGPAGLRLAGAVGALWLHLVVWIVVTVLNAQSGLTLIGREVPGAKLFKRHLRTPVSKLPPEMQANRDRILAQLVDQAVNNEDGNAFFDYSVLSGERPNSEHIRVGELAKKWTQRQLAGLPWYYSPAGFEADRVERCAVFWGCLLLAAMTMIRWPGVNALLPHVVLRTVLFLIRIAAPTGLLAACLLGTSARPDVIALIAGCVLVGVGVLVLAYWLAWLLSRDVGPTRHYAPFMATRLLQKRRIAFFAIGAVTLCVAMVLIVISVMGGFLDLVRDRSRGLLGDLIMQNRSLTGFAGYQEFADRIKRLKDEHGRPIVYEATPVIYTYGVLRFPISKVTKMVRVVGVRLNESVRVTRFGPSLNYNKYYPGTTTLARQRQPYWGIDPNGVPVLPPDLEAARKDGLAKITDPEELVLYERRAGQDYPGPEEFEHYSNSDVAKACDDLRMIQIELQLISEDAATGNWTGASVLDLTAEAGGAPALILPSRPESKPAATASAPAPTSMPSLADRQKKIAARMEEALSALPDWPETKPMAETLRDLVGRMMDVTDKLAARDKSAVADINAILAKLEPQLRTLSKIYTRPGYTGKALYGVILGRDLVAQRQASGRYERYYPRGSIMTVAVLPLTTQGAFVRQDPIRLPLRYADDSRMGVYEIDSVCAYVDFEMLQRTMEMGPLRLTDGTGYTSPRASQVLIKLTDGQDILAVRERLVEEWKQFALEWPHERDWQPMGNVRIDTWEEQQALFIAAVQKEKILVLTLFSVISAVAIFLVLCIFYMIVTEKTRDIGILKSVGASAGGVTGVFLAYGAAIGLVGASLGTWIGTVFVHNINTFQDWIARIHPGLRIWSPEVYTFDIIPDTVKFEDAAVIFIVAIVSSVLGAAFPALRAGRTWPVEALRYE